MNLPEIVNRTPFAFGPLYLADEDGRPLVVLLARATFSIEESGDLTLAEQQMAITPAGKLWDPTKLGSYKYEPDAAFVKLGTDVILLGHAWAPRPGSTVMDVGIRVGPVQKIVRVFGDRHWVRSRTGFDMTDPEAFERIPLLYERAFGGWDRTSAEPADHTFEPRNPVGTGFLQQNGRADYVRLPNLEDPRTLIAEPSDRPAPAGFGFTSPDWAPRSRFAGTYDDVWDRSRKPLLPTDFDRRYFSAASSGLTVSPFLTGDESVIVSGCTPERRLEFRLPGVGPAQYLVRLRSQPSKALVGSLDTVVVDCDARTVHLTWRTGVVLRHGAQEVQEIEVDAGNRW